MYEWQMGRQLKKVSRDGQCLAFEYDSNGLRTKKTLEQDGETTVTEYTYSGKRLTYLAMGYYSLHEVMYEKKLHFFYDAQDRPAKVCFNNAFYSYIHNLQGDRYCRNR